MVMKQEGPLWVARTSLVISDPICGLFFGGPTNLPYQNDTLCIIVVLKYLESINKVSTCNNITTHSNAEALTETCSG
jgi:hypothetical protein